MFDSKNNQPITIPDSTSSLNNLTNSHRLDKLILPADKNCSVLDHRDLYAQQLDVLRQYYRQPMSLKEYARLAIRRQYAAVSRKM